MNTTTSTSNDLRKFFFKRFYSEKVSPEYAADMAKVREQYMWRGLVCTPFFGNYDRIAGWVICVNGSPPKGTLFLPVDGPDLELEENQMLYIHPYGPKKISREHEKVIIRAFYAEHLQDQHKIVVLNSERTIKALERQAKRNRPRNFET